MQIISEQQEQKAVKCYAEAIDNLVDVTKTLPQVKLGLLHLFSVGYYARVLTIPAGTLLIGKVHKVTHAYSLVSGTMRITEGSDVYEVTGPSNGRSLAGTQRVGVALTECKYMTIHQTNKTTLAEIEAEVIEEELCLGQ
jgi:hypothetical protein